jgi:hypothetical protein
MKTYGGVNILCLDRNNEYGILFQLHTVTKFKNTMVIYLLTPEKLTGCHDDNAEDKELASINSSCIQTNGAFFTLNLNWMYITFTQS